MRPFSARAPASRPSSNATREPSPQDTTVRNALIPGALIALAAVAYFHLADKYFFSTASMSPIFRLLLMGYDLHTAWLALAVYMLAFFWTNPAPVLTMVDFVGKHIGPVSLSVVGASALGTLLIYHNDAFCMDEYAAVFQAKVFAAGQLRAHLPPSVIDWLIPRGFNGEFLMASRTTGEAVEAYWPGFALLLAPFEFAGVPWLCNAILAGLAVFLIHRITFEITRDTRAAGWAVVFTVASGAFVANAISYYSMQAHLTANLLFVWLLLKPTAYRMLAAGAVGSLALILHNPFPHALFAAPWIIAITRAKDQRRYILPLALGYLPLLIFIGIGWLRLRGMITEGDSGLNVVSGSMTSPFSWPTKAMVDSRTAAIMKMWIWAVPGLFVFAGIGRLRRGDDARVRLMTQSAMITFVAYIFVVFDQGHGWGYRYFHSAWGVVPILAACAMTVTPESNGRLAAFAGAVSLLSIFVVVPYQLIQIDGIITAHSAQLPPARRPGSNVYFVGLSGGFYPADLIQMDPLLRSDDLILASRGAALDAQLREQNWPNAALIARTSSIEEWHLDPKDQRTTFDATGKGPFVFAFANPKPAP